MSSEVFNVAYIVLQKKKQQFSGAHFIVSFYKLGKNPSCLCGNALLKKNMARVKLFFLFVFNCRRPKLTYKTHLN